MFKIKIALREVGESVDLIGVVAGSNQTIVEDVRRDNVTVGLSVEGNPVSVRIRDAQNMSSIKEIVTKYVQTKSLTASEMKELGKLCNHYMTMLEAAYKEQHAVIEMA